MNIITESQNIINQYNQLSNSSFDKDYSISQYYPSSNYYSNSNITSFTRYFAKKINDTNVFEISFSDFKKSNSLNLIIYNTISIDWQVRGIERTMFVNSVYNIGVYEYNKSQVKKAELSLAGISKILTNFLQFYQGIV